MGTNAVQRDATAETVSANVKRLRTQQNLGLRGLSKKLGEIGRPLGHSAIDQIEKGTRRVDVDDLVALALALDASPLTLLRPPTDGPLAEIPVTGVEGRVPVGSFQEWLRGYHSITPGLSTLAFMGNALQKWEQARWIKEPDGDH
ncbi:MAG: helix-turn-helix domain-containing protein [Mycobacterium sp.]